MRTLAMRRLATLIVLAAVLSACGSGTAATPAGSPTPNLASRPPTSASVTILSPGSGAVVHGSSVNVVIGLSGAVVTKVYSAHVDPHEGHIHLYLDNQLIYMNYTLHQDVPVHPGFQYSLYAEFVAADHFPFNPRDRTATIYFSVQP
jgi:hypothetical protein